MQRTRKVILVVGIVGLIGLILVLMAMPGTVMTAKVANGEPADRTGVAALLGLLILGFMALGMDFRDWF